MAEPEKLTVAVNDIESVTAMLYPAGRKNRARVTIVLGHGAGADQMSGFMRMVASGFAARGLDAMTFNFIYKEKLKSVPDPKAKLEACYQAIINAAIKNKKLKGNKLVIGGKSMGGRIASQVAAEHFEGIDGLVFLGYPLHPPGRPDQLRTRHLPAISVPMLIVQGERDAFGTPDELRPVLRKLRAKPQLYVVEGGDHSFKVPKSAGTPQPQIHARVLDEIERWLRATTGI